MDFLTAFQACRRGAAGWSTVFARVPALFTDKRRAYATAARHSSGHATSGEVG
jgi:hypothetical protein